MDIRQANAIRITDFLTNLGHTPAKQDGSRIWYLSPLRDESTPSFKVNEVYNSWYDFGLGKGGNLFELAKKLYHTDNFAAILRRIEETMHSTFTCAAVSRTETKVTSNGQTFRSWRTRPLQNTRLVSYLESRKIPSYIAREYCQEVYYGIGDKTYFAIAFKNDSEGFEIRNPYFKGCFGCKDITTVRINHDSRLSEQCCVFEGFFDFLSYMTAAFLMDSNLCQSSKCDCLVLNSVGMADTAIAKLKPYHTVHCYLDNDTAGRLATQKFAESLNVTDESARYSQFNDVNEYLCSALYPP